MQQPNRNFTSSSYRYGFQGQEKDDELKGEGNSLNYKYRMHDPRIGRFFAVDPLTSSYPNYSPYSFSGNKVVAHVEFEGLEERYVVFSEQQAEKIKKAFKKNDYIEVARIADYGMNHGFVDDNQNASTFVYEKLKFSHDYEFLRKNVASIAMYKDETLNKGMMVFEKAIYNGDDKYGNPIIEIETLGQIDLNEVRRKANGRRWSKWIEYMKVNNYPQEYFEEFRDNGAAFANGGNVTEPPSVKDALKWPTGAFDTSVNSANRTGQANDIASWSEFIEDYTKNPKKYRKAAKEYFERFYVPAIKRQIDKENSEYSRVVPVEFESKEKLEETNKNGNN